jgi:preprotein translocase subunit SecA
VSDQELRERGLSLKYKATTGSSVNDLVPAAFALAYESVRRTTGKTLYPVQVYAGIQLARCQTAEMKTGEGKTLTATLPTFLHALFDRGAHVVTVNDYLAKRDFELMGPIYQRLGLSVGVVQSDDAPEARRAAYRKDITYGTAKEFGFDFLRDRMKMAASSSFGAAENLVMRELYYVLVDEADSVLIDEARTPLIIGVVDAEEEMQKRSCFQWAAQHADKFVEKVDFKYEHDKKKVTLLNNGIGKTRELPQNSETKKVSIRKIYEYIENAIKVKRDFQLDQHYVVRDGKIAIVDEFTGRIAEGRQWQRGIHQAVEAKEQIEITPATRQGASVTLQSFFRRYENFAGMSGTLWTSRREFKKVYKKKVVRIPTHRPVNRKRLPTRIFADAESKMNAVVIEAAEVAESGRAVLIGTRSVESSVWISNSFSEKGIAHRVLNANHDEQEAEIVGQSGIAGQITVATNMAGRGTDIVLDERVQLQGGLHVILTELHESQRIDWQLIGRGSRQGDPGSYRIFLSLEDELLLSGLGPVKSKSLKDRFLKKRFANRLLSPSLIHFFRQAQTKVEHKHLVDRMILMKQDKERHERHFEMGMDPYCDVVQG